ncbi:MAG: nucleolus (ISS) [Trebouxia sp. A1-2]|nr:MAG: nucleolus (ISS) [Trebouxia sp. A1-2]
MKRRKAKPKPLVKPVIKSLKRARKVTSDFHRVTRQIGAVNAQLLSVPWLSVRAIDLRPCLPSIEQADFLQIQPAGDFDIVVCAMVLNCVPSAQDRGNMLLKTRGHLQHGGHAFIVTPLRCLNDSPYMTANYFEEAVAAAGLQVKHSKLSPKLAFYCLEAAEICAAAASMYADPNKIVARGSKKTNDFAISFDEATVQMLKEIVAV